MEVEPTDSPDGDSQIPGDSSQSNSNKLTGDNPAVGSASTGNPYLPNTSADGVPLAESVERPIEKQSLSMGGWLAWACVFGSTFFIIGLTIWAKTREAADTAANKSDLMQIQMQARVVVGQRNMLPTPKIDSQGDEVDGKTADDDATVELESSEDRSNDSKADNDEDEKPKASIVQSELNDGTYEQRICYTILVSEIDGPEAGLESLQSLDEAAGDAEFELDDRQQELRSTVGKLIAQHAEGEFDSSALPEAEKELVVDALDWIGELALHPKGTPAKEKREALMAQADSSIWKAMGMMGIGALVLFAGFVALMLIVGFFATKKFRPHFALQRNGMNIYIETFAIWLVVFFGAQNLVGMLGLIHSDEQGMIVSPIIFFASLLVLVYPVVRGIPFSQVLADIGIRTKTPFREFAAAPISYLALLPVMLVSLFVVFVLMMITTWFDGPRPFGAGAAPGHPIQEFLAEGNVFMIFLVFVSACVAAPVVEEIMFRGVLYRHLRELTGHRSRWLSVAISAIFNGLIFAAIHPQGLVAIPMLTTLAIGFSLAREWRDSLVTAMLMHALNNGIVTCLILTMM